MSLKIGHHPILPTLLRFVVACLLFVGWGIVAVIVAPSNEPLAAIMVMWMSVALACTVLT